MNAIPVSLPVLGPKQFCNFDYFVDSSTSSTTPVLVLLEDGRSSSNVDVLTAVDWVKVYIHSALESPPNVWVYANSEGEFFQLEKSTTCNAPSIEPLMAEGERIKDIRVAIKTAVCNYLFESAKRAQDH
ncbi:MULTISPECIES: hypothetical protein [Vibrio]|uniref:hypothetical protein n=1 Tax=Vibrio TaxID=662 RepID=UPI001E388E65|nr:MULTISPECIES: hypothetical protein [Vibrio]MCC2525546.1 hypothetical protein [Vibrio coralliilyticus]USD35558.1 hypothetical protein J8Z27_22360 [Vibrio sp. SCSIO 43186]USD72682.1 hypothetical protein J4N41_22375 [Vibrio sp. SCSIO 43139]USD98898.1 hypothetical protein CTT30_22715 [Vibrio coralliilyticus]